MRCCSFAVLFLVLTPFVDARARAAEKSEPGSVVSGATGTGLSPAYPELQTAPSGSITPPAEAAEEKLQTAPSGSITPPGEATEEKPGTLVDVVHAEISQSIQGTATWMDSFFGDWRYASELNESYVRFGYNVIIEKQAHPYRKPNMQIRFILPQLRKKTRLVLSGSPRETRDFSAVTLDSQREQTLTTEDTNVSAAVHQTFFESARQNFIIRTGARLHDMRPLLTLGPRYRVLFLLDPWSLRFSEDMTWTSNAGWDSQAIIDLERPLPRQLFFRASSSLIWKEHIKGYLYAVSFAVGQPLSRSKALDYEWVNIFQTRPVHVLTEVDVRIRYRQRLWRDWFFFEIAPQYRFPRNRDFEAVPGVVFRFDMIFGNYANFI